MGILQRIVGRLTGPDPVAMARRIGRCLDRQAEAVDRSDNDAVTAALRDLDREVLEFVKIHHTGPLYAAVGYWAAHIAKGNQALIVAAFFFDHSALGELVDAFRTDGPAAGTGLILFEEGLNRAGLTMSPSYLDKTRARFEKAPPAPSDPLAALAEVLWPISERETQLREGLAKGTGLSVNTVAWELFAVRDAGFEMGSKFGLEDMGRQDILEKKVLPLIDRRLGDVPTLTNLKEWYIGRQHLYERAIKDLEGPSNAAVVRWLERVRSTFQSCLGSENPGVGQIGGAEYDRAMSRTMEICKGIDFDALEMELPVVDFPQIELPPVWEKREP